MREVRSTTSPSTALVAITSLAIWTLGGLLLRGLGTIRVLAGLAMVVGGRPTGLAVTLMGATAWLGQEVDRLPG